LVACSLNFPFCESRSIFLANDWHWLGTTFIDFFERALVPLGYVASTYDGKSLCPDPVRYHALLMPKKSGFLKYQEIG
jgi:hypothetical protein